MGQASITFSGENLEGGAQGCIGVEGYLAQLWKFMEGVPRQVRANKMMNKRQEREVVPCSEERLGWKTSAKVSFQCHLRHGKSLYHYLKGIGRRGLV